MDHVNSSVIGGDRTKPLAGYATLIARIAAVPVMAPSHLTRIVELRIVHPANIKVAPIATIAKWDTTALLTIATRALRDNTKTRENRLPAKHVPLATDVTPLGLVRSVT